MSGRVAALDAVREGDRLTVLHRRRLAAASGSRSTAARPSSPSSTSSRCSRSARSTIDPKNPKTIWVGTGESWTRNSVSIGDGIYKSDRRRRDLDQRGPRRSPSASSRSSWTRRPPTPSTPARPASSGATRDERGVYKTTDGGKTWTKVLKGANLSTGCSMISMDTPEPEDALRRHVGLPAQGLDVPLRRRRARRAERQRPLQVDRRRRDLDRARRRDAEGPARRSRGAASR